jgi:hypothetical protein
MPPQALFDKYTQEGWEVRLKSFNQEVNDRIRNPSGPKSTIKKRTVKTLDSDGYLIAHVVTFFRADGSAVTLVTLLVDGDTAFFACE